jgi:hypothetical protein
MAFNFNKKDDFDYNAGYDYLGGVGLGRAEEEANRIKLAVRGTYDLEPVEPPSDTNLVDKILKTANTIHRSKNRCTLVGKIKQAMDSSMRFVWDTTSPSHAYYEWAQHCIDREVQNWPCIRPTNQKSAPISKNESQIYKPVVGDWVEVFGIQSRPELNGKYGSVISEASGRMQVLFPDIHETVSIKISNLKKSKRRKIIDKKVLPKGLKIQIVNLNSDKGQMLNGQCGTVTDYSPPPVDRYMIRLDLDNSSKNVKIENIKIPLPTGWVELFDESLDKVYYSNNETKQTTWTHPIFHYDPSHNENSDIDDEEEEDGEFSRNQFLKEEEERLGLNKKKQKTAESIEHVILKFREQFGIRPPSGVPLFVGTPRGLAEDIELNLNKNLKGIEKIYITIEIIRNDLNKLMNNKIQFSELIDNIEKIENSEYIPNLSYFTSALKIAVPETYTIY